MTTINDLSVATSVSSDDKVPLWQNANGVTRALPISVLDGRYLTQEDVAALAADAKVETFISSILPNPGGLPTFVAGTTFSLTLANQYYSENNIEPFFDASFQGPDQYSLVGFGLTFNAPIPLGVQMVYVRGGAARIIGAPSDGTVGTSALKDSAVTTPKLADDAVTANKLAAQSVADASLIAGSKIFNRANDIHDVSDVGAIGDGVADDSVSLQTMFTNAVNVGWSIPSGIFKFGTGLVSDYSAMTAPTGNPSARGDIRGDSQSNTILRYSGAGYALMMTGSTTGQGLNSFDKYSGFTITDNSQSQTNNGIYLLNRALFKFEDVLIAYFINGLVIDGSFTAALDNVHCNNNKNGLTFLGSNFEDPNLIRAASCTFNSNSLTGVTGNINAAIEFDSCDISANGTQGNLATGGILLNIAGPLSGPLSFKNCYFENNAGSSDIQITNVSGQPAVVVISGCTFNRGLNTAFTINNITVHNTGAGSTTKLILEGNSFVSVNSYVPSSSRLFVNPDANTEVIDLGNAWSENVSRTPNPVTHGRVTGGSVTSAGVAISVPLQISVSRISAGVYSVTHNTGFAYSTGAFVPIAVSNDTVGGIKVERITVNSTTQFNVVLTNTGGTPTDAPFSFHVLQLG